MPALYLHIDEETHQNIEAIAKAEERTWTTIARNLLREAIAARKSAEQAEDETIG